MPNSSQIGGIVRALLAALAGFAVNKGWIPAEGVTELVSAGVVIAVAAWSMATNKAKP